MSLKKYEIIIDEGSAENKSVFVEVDNAPLNSSQQVKDAVITEAIKQHIIQTKDVRWINDIQEMK